MTDDVTLTLLRRKECACAKLFEYCRKEGWRGFDPYDALTSRVLNSLGFSTHRLTRLMATHLFKWSPINIRGLFAVEKHQNPKSLAILLKSAIKLLRLGMVQDATVVNDLVARLLSARSPGEAYWCWGYSFPWQTRKKLVPKDAPNSVCTVFVCDALLDVFDLTGDSRLLDIVASSSRYMVEQLYWRDGAIRSFSYPLPENRIPVHNANLLVAALLARLDDTQRTQDHEQTVIEVTAYTVSRQNPDGSWFYGEGNRQQWIDNFHTGYNLCALHTIQCLLPRREFESSLVSGMEYYTQTFVSKGPAPRYFSDRRYPIDTHTIAQSVLTMIRLRDYRPDGPQLANAMLDWAMQNMLDANGYFYYQKMPFWTNKISYLRWSQAWMLLALAESIDFDRRLMKEVALCSWKGIAES